MVRFPVLISCWLIFSTLFAPSLFTQVPPVQPQVEAARAAVTLDDQHLFYVVRFKGYSAEMRAERIRGVLQEVADDESISASALGIADDVISTDVMLGSNVLFSVTDADASEEGISRQELGNKILKRIGSAIEQYRRERAPHHLFLSIIYSVLATLALGALMWVFFRWNRKLISLVVARVRPVTIKSHEVVRAEWILRVLRGIWEPIRLIIIVGLSVVYLELVLSQFPWTRPYAFHILGNILVPLRAIGYGFWSQLPNFLTLAVVFLLTRYLLKVLKFLFSEIADGRIEVPGFYPDWSRPTFNIVRVLVTSFALVFAFPYIPGSDSPAFKGISVFLGVLVSLGSSSAISNVVAGITLTYMRAYRIGDVVTIGDSNGIVTGVGTLVTRIQTFKDVEITIPNSIVLSAHITNFSKAAGEEGLILHTSVTIGYDTPWRQVEALLLLAADRTPGLLREPAPYVLQRDLGDFYITYELNVRTDAPEKMFRTYSALHANVQDAFNEFGVQIMSPNYIADRSVPTIVPRSKWFTPPAKKPEEGNAAR